MSTIKNRNSKDLTEAEEIKKRWQEYIEELCKRDFNDPDNHNRVITHLEPDILECEVKRAVGSITVSKASGGGGIPNKLFQILKDDVVKVLHPICQQIWKTQKWPQDRKRSVFVQILKKAIPMNVQSAIQLCSFHMLAPSFKLGFNTMCTENFQMYKLDLEKAEEPEIKFPTSVGLQKK